jgi:Tol biopolymer transport system component
MRFRLLISVVICFGSAESVAADQDSGPCERQWTFPVPFYQSIAWSPDGSKIALAAITTSWEEGYRILVVKADGSEVTRLDTGGDPVLYPVWSPDGLRIAFSSGRGDKRDIYVMKADGTEITRLTQHDANDGYPSWSPDGTKIAFHSDRDGNYEIYVMNADGSDPTRITKHLADDYNPAWSPDGTRIAFDSDRDEIEGDEVYVVSPDGFGISQVVDNGVFPTWSPDSKKILFTSDGLYVVGVDGAGASRLVEHAVYGAWSPDGTTIAAAATEYDKECKDHHAVIALKADGSGRVKLLPR